MKYTNSYRIVCLLLGLLLFQGGLKADDEIGSNAAPFLNIRTGARGVSMGGAYLALVDDATAIYWNPAGLDRHRSLCADFSYLSYGGTILSGLGLTDLCASLRIPVGRLGTLGFGWRTFSVDDIEYRLNSVETGDPFSFGNHVFYAGIGSEIVESMYVGLAVTVLSSQFSGLDVSGTSANGMGLSLGMVLEATDWLAFGLKVDDNFKVTWDYGGTADADEVPFRGNAGLCVKPVNGLNIVAEAEKVRQIPIMGHLGAEWALPLNRLISGPSQIIDVRLRAGLLSFYDNVTNGRVFDLSFGGGMQFNIQGFTVRLDYAYLSQDFSSKQIISCSFSYAK